MDAEDREGMIVTLSVLSNKSEEYYRKLTDEQLDEEYERFIGT